MNTWPRGGETAPLGECRRGRMGRAGARGQEYHIGNSTRDTAKGPGFSSQKAADRGSSSLDATSDLSWLGSIIASDAAPGVIRRRPRIR